MSDRYIRPGEEFTITRIERSDPDSFAVIHYNGRYAFGCGATWFTANQPKEGDTLVMGADAHWKVIHRTPAASAQGDGAGE